MATEDQELAALEARIAKARAEQAALEEARAGARKRAELLREAERAEQRLKDEPILVKLEEEHGELGVKIAALETERGVIVVKKAHHLHYKKFANKADPGMDDLWALVKPSILHPTVSEADKIIEEFPAILVKLAGRVCELSGLGTKEVEKK